MKASDTVMSQIHGIGTLEGVCKLQAKVSFKAGIKEVVEWINEHKLYAGNISIPFKTWQSKLKEWGL